MINQTLITVSSQITPKFPQPCPPSAASTMLGICFIPVVVLCCSEHWCCAVERDLACCAKRCTANATLTVSTSKAPFELVYGENVMVPLDHLTGATQILSVQAARLMVEEVSQLVDAVKTELETA